MMEKSFYRLFFTLIWVFFLAASLKAEERDHNAVLVELNQAVRKTYNLGHFREGILLAEKGMRYARENLGNEHPATRAFMVNLATLYQSQGIYDKAETLYKKGILSFEEELGEEHHSVLILINNLANLYLKQDRYAEAEPLCKKSVRLCEKVLGEESPDTITSISTLALFYTKQGLYSEAEPLWEKAMQLSGKVLGKEHPGTLMSINNLASLYEYQGHYGEAEHLYKKALKLSEKVLGKVHPNTQTQKNNLALIYAKRGRYGEAEPLFKDALQIRKKILGKEHPETLSSVNNLAQLYKSQGRYKEAEPLCKEAVQLSEKIFGKKSNYTLVSMNNLASLFELQGLYNKAEPLFREASQLSEKVLGKEHPDTLISISNLAGLYQSQGRYGDAEPLFKEVLQLREKVLGKEHPDTLRSTNNLALLYQSQGRYCEAKPLYKEALQLSEKESILGPYHPTTLTIMTNYIGLMVAMGRDCSAFRLMKQMEDRMLSMSFQELYSTADEKTRRLYLKNISYFQDIVFSFALKYPKPAHISFSAEIVLRWKQVWAEEYAFQHRLMCVSTDPDVKEVRVRMSRLRSEFGNSLYHKGTNRDIGAILMELNQAEDELREKARATKPQLLVAGSDLELIMSSLPKHSVLIEFQHFNLVDFKTGEVSAPNWLAYLLLPDIEAEQQVYLENFGAATDLIENVKNAKDSQSAIYAMFIEKLSSHLKNVEILYIAPDGFLNLIPFAALKTPTGQYLAERFQINRLQTGRDLLETPADKTAPLLAVFGGVTYGDFGNDSKASTVSDKTKKSLKSFNPNLRADRELDSLPYLKHSLDEIETIAMIFRNNIRDGEVKRFRAHDASEKALRELGRAPRILHLSTHGFFLENAEDTPLAESRPMILSGLALSGANLGLQGLVDPNGDDGLLYSMEILNLDLQGTELVSLSACETGKGVTDYSEGVYGLVRAFRTAGARSVLMTLTQVKDRPSKDFMVKFYEKWLFAEEGTPPAKALHDTRLHFIRHQNPKYSDPAFWSPYVLVGGS